MNAVDHRAIRRLVGMIDYSEALTVDATEAVVKSACAAARRYGFRAVVAFPQYVGQIARELAGTGVLAQVPVGFPCGGTATAVKCFEAEEGLRQGATDLDMVMNIAAFKEKNYQRVAEDIEAVLKIARPHGIPFKVIIETGMLDDEEKAAAAKLVADCGADFVKTCTGFGPGRATVHDIALLKRTLGGRIGIKASGSVLYIEDALTFVDAGATVVAMRESLIQQLAVINYRPDDKPSEKNPPS